MVFLNGYAHLSVPPTVEMWLQNVEMCPCHQLLFARRPIRGGYVARRCTLSVRDVLCTRYHTKVRLVRVCSIFIYQTATLCALDALHDSYIFVGATCCRFIPAGYSGSHSGLLTRYYVITLVECVSARRCFVSIGPYLVLSYCFLEGSVRSR